MDIEWAVVGYVLFHALFFCAVQKVLELFSCLWRAAELSISLQVEQSIKVTFTSVFINAVIRWCRGELPQLIFWTLNKVVLFNIIALLLTVCPSTLQIGLRKRFYITLNIKSLKP